MLKAMVTAFKIPDLRRKILFTLAMLVVFRLISHIPVPLINAQFVGKIVEQNAILGMLDLFSGGALVEFSVAAMGVYPYITASIVMQLLVPIIPALERLSKEGEVGQQKINRWTYWLTIPLAGLQAYGQVALLARSSAAGSPILRIEKFTLFDPAYILPTLTILSSMIAGTMVLIWIGDLITEQGVGNGLSIIIFGGIVSRLPTMVGRLAQGGQTAMGWVGVGLFLIIGLLTIVAIVLVQEGKRELRVQYSRRVRGTKLYGGGSTTLPLRVNMAGMIPLIFAQSMMVFPGTVASYLAPASGVAPRTWVQRVAQWVMTYFNATHYFYWILLFILVVFFTYFYTIIVFSQTNIAENLKKSGGFIPGYRPGEQTERLLNGIVNRITLVGALFLGVVAVLPFIVQKISGLQGQGLQLSATALLIVVGVAVDTMKQLEAQLLIRRYEGFL
jgi:preprotein translocase subunit SecY